MQILPMRERGDCFYQQASQPTQTVTITLSVSQVNSSQSSVQSSSIDRHTSNHCLICDDDQFCNSRKMISRRFFVFIFLIKNTHTQFWIWINFWTIFFCYIKNCFHPTKKTFPLSCYQKNRPFNRHASYSFVGPLFKKWQFRFFQQTYR